MNEFESGARKAIPAVLVYLRSRGRILMLHRNAAGRVGDYHAGKWNGLGGKCELDESAREAARRETREESGVDLPEEAFQPLGTIQFPNFKAHKSEDWLVFVFVADVPDSIADGAAWRSGPEGDLHWVPEGDLLALNLWAGDRHFVPYVVECRPFMGTIWYRGAEVIRNWIQPLA